MTQSTKPVQISNTPSRAVELAHQHWTYVGALLRRERAFIAKALELKAECDEDYLQLLEFHYTTAFAHGYKHGQEDRNEASTGTDTLNRAPLGGVRAPGNSARD